VIFLNGAESAAPVTRRVVERLAPQPVRVETELSMPLGAGFGASGAGALSSAYAINEAFDGGLVVRLSAGAPGVGSVDRIPVPPLRIDCIVRGPLSTEEVLSDPSVMRGVNREGERALKELLRRPTLDRFVSLSWEFAQRSGLAKDWMEDAVEAVESSGGAASMVMLGDAVFAVGGAEALAEFGDVISAKVSLGGAGLE